MLTRSTNTVYYSWDPAVLVVLGFPLNIHKGEFPTIRHNEIRDVTANLLTEVCHEVQVEPGLQPISGERFQQASLNIEDGARLDMVFGEVDVRRPFWM